MEHIFLKKLGVVPSEAGKLFLKCCLASMPANFGSGRTKIFVNSLDQDLWLRYILDLDFNTLTFEPTLFFAQKCSKRAKSNPTFLLNGRRVGPWL